MPKVKIIPQSWLNWTSLCDISSSFLFLLRWTLYSVLETDGSDGCSTVWMYLMPQHTYKWLRWQMTCYICFTTILKNKTEKYIFINHQKKTCAYSEIHKCSMLCEISFYICPHPYPPSKIQNIPITSTIPLFPFLSHSPVITFFELHTDEIIPYVFFLIYFT